MSKNLIVGNWKMNPESLKEAQKLFNSIKSGKSDFVVCPPFVYLSSLKGKLGAQNCFYEDKGAYTGEVSASMLKNLGCEYVIIGHSERRQYFKEDNEMVNKKIKKALSLGLKPIVCIGETQQEREEEKTDQIIQDEIMYGLEGIPATKVPIIAYEPIWAIGTGNACDVEEAQRMGLLIRKIISKTYNLSVSKKLCLLYGGSANSTNASGYLNEAGFNGLLVGGASLKADEFNKIINA